MKSGFEIYWTEHALFELNETFEYLENEFSSKELQKLSIQIKLVTELISNNPELFPASEYREIRRAVIMKFNTLYYRIKDEKIEVISFYHNRKNPENKKF
jgi:plasmid stabilization system protein ParE